MAACIAVERALWDAELDRLMRRLLSEAAAMPHGDSAGQVRQEAAAWRMAFDRWSRARCAVERRRYRTGSARPLNMGLWLMRLGAAEVAAIRRTFEE